MIMIITVDPIYTGLIMDQTVCYACYLNYPHFTLVIRLSGRC